MEGDSIRPSCSAQSRAVSEQMVKTTDSISSSRPRNMPAATTAAMKSMTPGERREPKATIDTTAASSTPATTTCAT